MGKISKKIKKAKFWKEQEAFIRATNGTATLNLNAALPPGLYKMLCDSLLLPGKEFCLKHRLKDNDKKELSLYFSEYDLYPKITLSVYLLKPRYSEVSCGAELLIEDMPSWIRRYPLDKEFDKETKTFKLINMDIPTPYFNQTIHLNIRIAKAKET